MIILEKAYTYTDTDDAREGAEVIKEKKKEKGEKIPKRVMWEKERAEMFHEKGEKSVKNNRHI